MLPSLEKDSQSREFCVRDGQHLFDVGIKATKRVLKIDLGEDYVTYNNRLITSGTQALGRYLWALVGI